MAEQRKTHFGFREVDADDKSRLVGDVFHSVARRYDLMNDLLSAGIHRLWKRFAIELSAVRPGHRVLDLAGGTGDLAKLMAARVGRSGHVTLADINASMLGVGRDRLTDLGLAGNLQFVQANAESLPFPTASFDCVTIAFGLRNVTDKDRALAEMCRVLRPGGTALVLEFSKPRSRLLGQLYDSYSFHVMPKIGKWVTDDEASYRYLAESIRMHPDQDSLKAMMEAVGFERCTYYNLTGGIVALHKGVKPTP